jgi:putative ABC transport system permease protein
MLSPEWSALRRKSGRAALTVAGMACGVFALIVLAALAEHFSLLASHFQSSFADRVYVCEKLSFWAGGGILPQEKAAEAARVPGVGAVIPLLIGRLQTDRMIVVGLPEVLVGVPAGQAEACWKQLPLAEGRWLAASDEGTDAAMLGSDVAWSLGAGLDSTVRVLDHSFHVIGIAAHTGSLEDRQMMVSLPVAQKVLERDGLLTSLVVLPRSGVDALEVATALRHTLQNAEVLSPDRMREQVSQSLRLWRALILGLGLIAAASGALCIVITMLVAVVERTYEVGLRKAVGASDSQILQEFLWESLLLAALGWLVGLALSVAFVAGWDASFRREGMLLFALTPRVVWRSLAVALLLGLGAGTLPALTAARLDPVAALRRRL